MLPSYTAYSAQELVVQVASDRLSLPCQIEIQVGRDGHPDKLFVESLETLQNLHRTISDYLDNNFDNSREVVAK